MSGIKKLHKQPQPEAALFALCKYLVPQYFQTKELFSLACFEIKIFNESHNLSARLKFWACRISQNESNYFK